MDDTRAISPTQESQLASAQPLPLDRNPAAVYLAGLRESGRRTQRQALDTVAAMIGFDDALTCPWWELRYQHTAAIRAKLADQYKYTTANKMLCALRRVLKAAWKLELMAANDYHLAASVESIAGDDTTAPGREVTPLELAGLMAACARDPNRLLGARDAALFVTLYPGGLRREETVKLTLDIYDRAAHELTVKGKRNKTRTVPIEDAGTIQALDEWIALRGEEPGPLFCAIRKNGNLSMKPLKNQSVYDLLEKRTQEAGLEPFSPHDLRRSVTTHLLESGADVVLVAGYLGHSNVQTTRRYDRRKLKAMRKAIGALHIPYGGNFAVDHIDGAIS